MELKDRLKTGDQVLLKNGLKGIAFTNTIISEAFGDYIITKEQAIHFNSYEDFKNVSDSNYDIIKVKKLESIGKLIHIINFDNL